jgi:branched-chain amino acid transport system ATP-binding protein
MDISDRVVVLDYGRKIGDGSPDEVRANPEVIRAYLGTSVESTAALAA